MSVPAIALYATPPAGIHSPQDHDLTSWAASRPIAGPSGGLSRLFSSSPSARLAGGDEIASLWADRYEDLGCSLSYSPSPASSCRQASSPLRSWKDWSGRDSRERILGGFLRSALGSCLDHEETRLPVEERRGFDAEDLSFGLEEGCEPYAEELLAGAQKRHRVFSEEFVVKAFFVAEKAHRGQMRACGDPYLQHCVETAVLLAKIGANSTVVAAGLLHDTLDDSFMDYDYILQMFGTGLADLVEGVSKLSQLSKLARESNTASRTAEADRLHTMFLAMADARAVLIKLADRLHNMMTLEALPMIKQQRFAKETLEIFAPLANRLGISSWKEQLENLCFKYLYPEQHKVLSAKLLRCFDEAVIASTVGKLERALKDRGLSYHVLSGRHKSLYSIYTKMLKKKLSMDEIHDIHGLRLIVENEEDCYAALDIVHQIWPNILGRLKDYIAHPKFNGYQSLHTVVMSDDMLPLEIQIRSKEMHLQAEFGFAAHWRYKEGDCQHSSFVLQMVEWARWVVTWQCETMNLDRPSSFGNDDSIMPPCPFPSHSEDCPYSYTHQFEQHGPIFIIMMENEKMSVQEFPANSTVMDLLERVGRGNPRWSPYSFPVKEELRSRLNREPVSDPSQKLRMGDVVELTPAIPDKSLTEYREEIQRMYDRGLSLASRSAKRT